KKRFDRSTLREGAGEKFAERVNVGVVEVGRLGIGQAEDVLGEKHGIDGALCWGGLRGARLRRLSAGGRSARGRGRPAEGTDEGFVNRRQLFLGKRRQELADGRPIARDHVGLETLDVVGERLVALSLPGHRLEDGRGTAVELEFEQVANERVGGGNGGVGGVGGASRRWSGRSGNLRGDVSRSAARRRFGGAS